MAPIETPVVTEANCGDRIDNDGDGDVDLADADCQPMVALYAAPMD